MPPPRARAGAKHSEVKLDLSVDWRSDAESVLFDYTRCPAHSRYHFFSSVAVILQTQATGDSSGALRYTTSYTMPWNDSSHKTEELHEDAQARRDNNLRSVAGFDVQVVLSLRSVSFRLYVRRLDLLPRHER